MPQAQFTLRSSLGRPLTWGEADANTQALAIALLNALDPLQGSGAIAHNPSQAYPPGSVGAVLIALASAVGSTSGGGLQYLPVAGVDTIIATPLIPLTSYTAGAPFTFLAAGSNLTTSVTLNISGLGARPVTKQGATALAAGDLVAGSIVEVVYDGSNFQVIGVSSMSSGGASPIGSIQYFPVETPAGSITDPGGSVWLRTGAAMAYNPALHAQIAALGLVRQADAHGLVAVSQVNRWWTGSQMAYTANLAGGAGMRVLFSGTSSTAATDLSYFTSQIPVTIAAVQTVVGPTYHKGWFLWLVVSVSGGIYKSVVYATKDGNTFNQYTVNPLIYGLPTTLNNVAMAGNGVSLLIAYQTGVSQVTVFSLDFSPFTPALAVMIPALQTGSASPVNLVPGPDGIMVLDTSQSVAQFLYNDAVNAKLTAAATLASHCFDATYDSAHSSWIVSGIGGDMAYGSSGGSLTGVASGISEAAGAPALFVTPSGVVAWCSGPAATNAAAYTTNGGSTWTVNSGTTSFSYATPVLVGNNFVGLAGASDIVNITAPYSQLHSSLQFNDAIYFAGNYVYATGVGTGAAMVAYSTATDTSTINFAPSSLSYGVGYYSLLRNLNGTLVAAGGAGLLASSADSVNWTPRTTGITTAIKDATYAFTKYWLAFASDGTNNIAYGASLAAWTKTVGTSSAQDAVGFAFNGTTLVLAASGQLRYTTDGTTWTTCTGTFSGCTAIFYDSVGARFVALASPAAGAKSHPFYTSANGQTWAPGTAVATPAVCILKRIFSSNGVYYAFGASYSPAGLAPPYLATCLISSTSSLLTSTTSINTEMTQSLYGDNTSGESTAAFSAAPGNNEALLLNWASVKSINGTYSQVIGTLARMTYQQTIGFIRVQ